MLPEKVRDRLEQLDEMEDGPNLSNLTQAEYTKTIEEMGKVRCWVSSRRVVFSNFSLIHKMFAIFFNFDRSLI